MPAGGKFGNQFSVLDYVVCFWNVFKNIKEQRIKNQKEKKDHQYNVPHENHTVIRGKIRRSEILSNFSLEINFKTLERTEGIKIGL